MIAIHIPVRIVGCENPAFGCTCCFGWFMSKAQFGRHVREARERERQTCPKCGGFLAKAKGHGFNRVRTGGRFAHNDCTLDEGKAKAFRRQQRLAEAKEHREAVHLAVLRGERL
jgi:hypothetical protein